MSDNSVREKHKQAKALAAQEKYAVIMEEQRVMKARFEARFTSHEEMQAFMLRYAQAALNEADRARLEQFNREGIRMPVAMRLAFSS
jgi:microsomal dipeptidase-like Zn-dependent dipeptidase